MNGAGEKIFLPAQIKTYKISQHPIFINFHRPEILFFAIKKTTIYGKKATALAFRLSKSFSTIVIHTLCKSSPDFYFLELHLCTSNKVIGFLKQQQNRFLRRGISGHSLSNITIYRVQKEFGAFTTKKKINLEATIK